jgi:glycine/D-amino acid oxidase-like deaminating enzyme
MAVPKATKYAIIGAGIHGLSTAFHLAQSLKAAGKGSGADILVVDKTAIAAGASGISRWQTVGTAEGGNVALCHACRRRGCCGRWLFNLLDVGSERA